MNVLQGRNQFRAGSLLEEITGRTRGERVENMIRIFINRQHHELRGRKQRLQLADTFDTAHAGQIDVHQHHLRLLLRKGGQRRFSIPKLAQAAEARRAAEHRRQNLARRTVIFHNGHRNRHGGVGRCHS
jgi:hypothetical protein